MNPLQPRLKEITKEVYDKGFNIHMMIQKVKKERNLRVEFPIEVIIAVCEEYLRQSSTVRNPYTWFLKVFAMKSGEHFANQRIQEKSELQKKEVSPLIRDIMRNMGNDQEGH